MIQMYNTKFKDSAVICFWVMLITDTHTDLTVGPSKCVNPWKSPFLKSDPKTILSLPDMGNKK